MCPLHIDSSSTLCDIIRTELGKAQNGEGSRETRQERGGSVCATAGDLVTSTCQCGVTGDVESSKLRNTPYTGAQVESSKLDDVHYHWLQRTCHFTILAALVGSRNKKHRAKTKHLLKRMHPRYEQFATFDVHLTRKIAGVVGAKTHRSTKQRSDPHSQHRGCAI